MLFKIFFFLCTVYCICNVSHERLALFVVLILLPFENSFSFLSFRIFVFGSCCFTSTSSLLHSEFEKRKRKYYRMSCSFVITLAFVSRNTLSNFSIFSFVSSNDQTDKIHFAFASFIKIVLLL